MKRNDVIHGKDFDFQGMFIMTWTALLSTVGIDQLFLNCRSSHLTITFNPIKYFPISVLSTTMSVTFLH